jgi:hypothetical protein
VTFLTRELGANLSTDSKRFLLIVTSLYLLLALYLLFTNSILFPADYLTWYYPFRGYPDFREYGPFVSNHGYQDVPFFYHPYYKHLGEAAAQGDIAFWNPYIGLGFPNTGSHGHGFYFPLHWLTYPIFSPLAAHHIELTVQYFVCSTATYALFRRWTGNANGAIFGALAWTLGGWHAGYFQQPSSVWPLILLPFILLGFDLISEGRLPGVFMVSVGVGATIVEGHIQMTVATAMTVVFILLVRKMNHKVVALTAGVAGILLAAPHLWSLTEVVLMTNRESQSAETIKSCLLASQEYIGLLIPNFAGAPSDGFYFGRSLSQVIVNGREHALYLGQIPFLLALFAMLRLKDRAVRLLTLFVVSGLLLAGIPAVYVSLVELVPPLSFVTPLRFLFVVEFALCYLACLGWREFETSAPTFKEKSILAGVLAFFWIWASTFILPATTGSASFLQWILAQVEKGGIVKPPYFEGQFGPPILGRIMEHFSLTSSSIWWPFLLTVCTLAVVQLGKNVKVIFWGLLLLVSCDLASFFFVMNRPTPRPLYFPVIAELEALREGHTIGGDFAHIPTRVLGEGRGAHPNLLLTYDIATVEAYESIMSGDYRDIFRRLNKESPLAHQLAAVTESVVISPGLLDLLGVSVLYNHPSEMERREASTNLAIGPTRKTALRAFLSTSWRQVPDNSAIFEPDFDPRASVLLNSPAPFESSRRMFKEIEATFYGYDVVKFEVDLEEPALLVLTDYFYPGWTATVNEESAPILKAYGLVRAVSLPAGESKLTFRFLPNGFNWILLCVVSGVLVTIGATLWHKKLAGRGAGA